jgi:hypothetical protein
MVAGRRVRWASRFPDLRTEEARDFTQRAQRSEHRGLGEIVIVGSAGIGMR